MTIRKVFTIIFITAFLGAALFIGISMINYSTSSMSIKVKLDHNLYENIAELRKDFYHRFPKGTLKYEIDAVLIKDWGMKESVPWHKDGLVLVRGEASNHYNIFYLNPSISDSGVSSKNLHKLQGAYISIRYKTDNSLEEIESMGAIGSKGSGNKVLMFVTQNDDER